MRRELWRRGFRFRVHVSRLPGTPDIVFSKARLCVFVDGDFWHGRDWDSLKPRLEQRANSKYWVAKILANRDRDVRQTEALQAAGWSVVRVWEREILSDLEAAADRVVAVYERRRSPDSQQSTPTSHGCSRRRGLVVDHRVVDGLLTRRHAGVPTSEEGTVDAQTVDGRSE